MKKRLFSFMLSIIMMLSLSVTSFAANIDMDSEASLDSSFAIDEEFVSNKILENHGLVITPTASYHLLDTSGNPTYTCVEFTYNDSGIGYGIVDLCSYELVLYSLEKEPLFEEDDLVVYSGTLDFAVVQDDGVTAVDILTQDYVPIENIQNTVRNGLSVKTVTERENCVNQISANALTRSVETEKVVSGGYDEDLVYSSGNNSGTYTTDCGINAIAMYLRHLDEYFGGGYLLSTLTTESKLKVSLAAYTNRTLGKLTNLTTTQLATISNGYTEEHGTSHTNIASSSYTWTKFKNTIDGGDGVPCYLRVGAGETSYWDSAHFVIGVGHTAGATSTSGSIRVNSGWVSLGYVYIGTSIPSHIVN
nr:hypothetical protein [uncultured Dysosmobacter sp.]